MKTLSNDLKKVLSGKNKIEKDIEKAENKIEGDIVKLKSNELHKNEMEFSFLLIWILIFRSGSSCISFSLVVAK